MGNHGAQESFESRSERNIHQTATPLNTLNRRGRRAKAKIEKLGGKGSVITLKNINILRPGPGGKL